MKKNVSEVSAPRQAPRALGSLNAIESTRSRVLAVHELESFQRLSREQVEHVQHLLQHGHGLGIWQTPREWYEGGTEAQRAVDLRARTLHFLPAAIAESARALRTEQPFIARLVDDAVLSLTRYLLICRVGSVGMGRAKGRSLDPATLAWNAYSFLPVLAALSIEKSFHQGVRLVENVAPDGVCFANLDIKDLNATKLSTSQRKQLKIEVRRMRQLHERGLWQDAPAETSEASKTTPVSGPASPSPEPDDIEPHLPLPDDYVSDIGRKSVWLLKNLGPSLLKALEGFQGLWSRAAKEAAKPATLSRWCADYLSDFQWTDAVGERVVTLPFPVKLNGLGHRQSKKDDKDSLPSDLSFSWPPTGAAHVFGLCRTLQGAHMFIVGLSIGARRTELLTLKRSCIRYAKDDRPYANGRTFKLVQAHSGEERDWLLPDMAVDAIEQQAKLVALYERLSDISGLASDPATFAAGDHLWGRAGAGGHVSRGTRLSSAGLGSCVRDYGAALQMEPMPGGQPLRPHRFRKTLARLAALAITQAPKVLQDVFGHKSIEMTLYYILSDKDLMAEIETVAKELRIMRAQEVVHDMVAAEEAKEAMSRAGGEGQVQARALNLGGYGGAAAVTIQKAVRLHRVDAHRRGTDWGANDVRELAEILTMQGRDWQLVRPGVLCTKSVGQAGPCNKKKGKPEPSMCRARCDYRLEENWHREDVDQTIAEALDLYESEIAQGEDLVAELWAGQVRAHVGRFPDLEDKWMAHPRVRELVLGAA